jgi:hypothetical protein
MSFIHDSMLDPDEMSMTALYRCMLVYADKPVDDYLIIAGSCPNND